MIYIIKLYNIFKKDNYFLALLGFQEINDKEKHMSKKEYFYGYPRLITCEDNKLAIDSIGTGFINAVNLQNEPVYGKIINHMEKTKGNWSSKSPIDIDVLRIDTKFFKEILSDMATAAFEESRLDLQNYELLFDDLSPEERISLLAEHRRDKKAMSEKAFNDKYHSSLSQEQKLILSTVNKYDHIKEKQKAIDEKKENSKMMKDQYEAFKKKKEEIGRKPETPLIKNINE